MKLLATVALCLGTLFLATSLSQAQLEQWTGATSNNWFVNTNWNPANVPTSANNVQVDTNAVNPSVIKVAGAQARSLSVGTNSGDNGVLRVTNTGTLNIATAAFTIGNAGTGTVLLRDTSSTTAQQNVIVGAQTGSVGDLTVRDNAVLNIAGQLRVGDSGMGSLTSLGTGTTGFIQAAHMDVGTFNGGVGTVDLSNAGTFSNLAVNGVTNVGTSGMGTLTLHNGGYMYTDGLSIGTNSDGNGTVIIKGEIAAGTFVSSIIVTNSNNIDVGAAGTGDLELRNGGFASAENVHVGRDSGSSGTLLVQGLSPVTSTPSTLSAANDLSVGGTQGGPGGQGTLTIQNNGVVNVANNMWVWGGGTGTGGTLAIDNTATLTVGGTLDFDGGVLHFIGGGVTFANNVFFGNTQDPSGMIARVDSGNTGTLSGILTGPGALTKTGQGELDVNNNANTYSGGTFLRNGSLFVDADSALGTGALTVDGGTTVGSHVNGTTIANSVIVTGDFSVTPGTVLNFTGGVDLTGAVRSITNTVGFGTTEFDGVIKNGGVTLNSSVPFGLFIYGGSSANTYTGLTTVNDHANLVLDKTATNGAIIGDLLINQGAQVFLLRSDQIADDSVVTVNSSGVAIPGFSLQGFDEKIGTLFGDANGTVGLNDNAVTTAGTLAVGAGDFAGVISDQGAGGRLIKYGPGTLILSGDNTYVGETIINGGILQVDGSIASLFTTVNSGGTLAGIGSIGGNVVNGGTVSPGDSPGTLTVNGNYTQNASGNLIIEIASLATHDLLAIGGAANLDGTLTIVKLANFSVIAGDKVIFLTAANGVNGEFATVISDFGPTGTLIMPEVIYEANDVALLFAQGSFLIGGLTPNQTAVAVNLNNSVGDPRADVLINFLDTEPLANLPHDYDLIAPEELTALYEISFSKAIVQNMNLQHRTDDIRAGSTGFSSNGMNMTTSGPVLPDPGLTFAYSDGKVVLPVDNKDKNVMMATPENRWGVFVTGSGDFVNVNNNDDNAHGYDITTGTVLVGLDYRVCDHFAIGIDGSYSGGRANLVDDGRIDMDGGQAGAYATIYGFKILGSVIHFDAGVSGGWNNYDTWRNGLQNMRVRGSTDGSEFNAFAAYGGDWHFGRLLVGTWSSLQYTNVNVNSFTETGSLAPLSFPDQSEDSIRSSSGLRLAYDASFGRTIFRPEIRAAWEHEYGDRAYPIDARFASGAGGIFTVHGPDIGRDSALVDAGFTVLWNNRVSTYIFYDGNLGRSNYDNNAVSGGFRVTF